MYREEVAVSLAVAVFLAAAEVVSPAARTVFFETVAAFRGAAVVYPAGAAAVPLDRTVFRKILHCSPISANRSRAAVECHPVKPGINQVAVVHRWEEARHSCHLAIDPRNFSHAMKAGKEHVQVRFQPSAQVEATPEIFSGLPPGLELALRSVGQSRISPVRFLRIVRAPVISPRLLSNAQIGAHAR